MTPTTTLSVNLKNSLPQNQNPVQQKTMTVKQVAETLGISKDTVLNCIKRIMPNKMQQGKTTYLDEKEVACISKELKNNEQVINQLTVEAGSTVKNTTTELEVLANAASALTQLQELYNRKEAEYKSIIAQQQPKADYYDKFIDSSNLIEIGHLGKSTGIGEQKIFKRLVAEGYIKVRYSTDGVKYYDPCYGYEKYFKSVSVPFLRGEKQLNREKLMLTSDGYAYFMKKMGV